MLRLAFGDLIGIDRFTGTHNEILHTTTSYYLGLHSLYTRMTVVATIFKSLVFLSGITIKQAKTPLDVDSKQTSVPGR